MNFNSTHFIVKFAYSELYQILSNVEVRLGNTHNRKQILSAEKGKGDMIVCFFPVSVFIFWS